MYLTDTPNYLMRLWTAVSKSNNAKRNSYAALAFTTGSAAGTFEIKQYIAGTKTALFKNFFKPETGLQ